MVDVLHRGTAGGFSPTPPEICSQFMTHTGLFQDAPHFAVTHFHPDHFSDVMVRRFMDEYPQSKVYLPSLSSRGVHRHPLSDRSECVDFGNLSIISFEAIHEGAKFADDPNRIFDLVMENRHYLLCGDACLDNDLARRVSSVCPMHPDAAFINVYQLNSPGGKDFLLRIKPKRIFLYHLPFPEDDVYFYRKSAAHIISKANWPAELPKAKILSPMAFVPL